MMNIKTDNAPRPFYHLLKLGDFMLFKRVIFACPERGRGILRNVRADNGNPQFIKMSLSPDFIEGFFRLNIKYNIVSHVDYLIIKTRKKTEETRFIEAGPSQVDA